MIRRIFIFFIAAFVVLWLVGAHLLKSKVVFLVKAAQTDNFKFAYEDVKTMGFPFAWKVKIISPKFTITDQTKSSDIAFEQVIISFNYALTRVSVDFGTKVNLNNLKAEKPANYELTGGQDKILMRINLNKSIYFVKNRLGWHDIKSLAIRLPEITALQNEKQIFIISDANLIVDKTNEGQIQNVNVRIGGNYKGEKGFLKFQTANIGTDVDYMISDNMAGDNKRGILFERLLKINKGHVVLDKSSISLEGAINFNRDKLPIGDISVSMVKYPDLISQISPASFMLPSLPLRKIISRVAKEQAKSDNAFDNDNLKFKIKFSDEGLSVGKINLLGIK